MLPFTAFHLPSFYSLFFRFHTSVNLSLPSWLKLSTWFDFSHFRPLWEICSRFRENKAEKQLVTPPSCFRKINVVAMDACRNRFSIMYVYVETSTCPFKEVVFEFRLRHISNVIIEPLCFPCGRYAAADSHVEFPSKFQKNLLKDFLVIHR